MGNISTNLTNNYTVLHCHSMLSNGVTNIDSVTHYSEYIKKAKELGMKALAISEHGSVFEWFHKKVDMEKVGLKYIHAEEFYVTETLEEKIRDNYHCLLIAKNYEGFLELNKLSSKSFNREDNSFYYVPRISYEDLKNTSDNIIICTACIAGILSKGSTELKNDFFNFILEHKERCFFELQPHLDDYQIEYNKLLYSIAEEYGINCVLCTDTHALDKESVKGRLVLQKAKGIHFDNEDNFHLEFLSYDELIELCKQQNAIPFNGYLKAIEQTNKIADMIEPWEIDYSYKYPHLWGEDSERVLRDKIIEGIKFRGVDKYQNYEEYLDRIEYEMKAYKHNQAIDFMLLMEDICSWCRENDIGIGYGRGSVNGSVIAWLLNITEMDSIKHKLNFDRFMNIERVSLSDIDTDFPPSRINDVKQYIMNKHGLYCSDIITFNTIALKGAIRDVGRALEFPLSLVSEICDNIELKEDFYREKYPELFEYVDMLNGTIVSVGNHPCGLVVSPFSIDDKMGLFSTSTDTVMISQINMKEIDAQNYVKLDLLKLDTIELINETCKLANIERITPDKVDITDVNVWNSIRDDTTQIFQWEGDTGDRYIKSLLSDENIEKFKKINENVDRMTLLSIGNSAIRPAGASYREDLANGVVRKSGSKAIDDFLKPTFGYLVFQCQIIEFLHEYCGFTMGEADVVRRHFAKKYGTDKDIPVIKNGGYINDKKDHYIDGFIETMKKKYNMTEEESEKTIASFLTVIEDASNYLFSLNHSEPYSYEGYVSGWLRYYYPLEFLTVALNINKDNEDKTLGLMNYAKKNGINIKNPKFRYSTADYFCDKNENCIYKGIGSIKFMNNQVANELFELKDNSYDSFIDLLKDIKEKTTLNSKQLDILIKINYFVEFGNINELLRKVYIYKTFGNCKSLRKDKCEKYGIDFDIIRKCCEKESEKMFNKIDSEKLVNILFNNIHLKTEKIEEIAYEVGFSGYTNETDNTLADNLYVVCTIETNKYGTNFVTIYQVNSGKTFNYKINRKVFQERPCSSGDILKCVIRNQFKRIKDENDEWIESQEEETILKDYVIIKRLEDKLNEETNEF